jgi:hypothetical protein
MGLDGSSGGVIAPTVAQRPGLANRQSADRAYVIPP